MTKRFFAWYDNKSDAYGRPYWEGAGWYEAETPEEAARMVKEDGCLWTSVCVTAGTEYPSPDSILARA